MARISTHRLTCPNCKREIRFHQAFFSLDKNGDLIIELADYCTACDSKTVSKKFTVPELTAKCRAADFEELGLTGKKEPIN